MAFEHGCTLALQLFLQKSSTQVVLHLVSFFTLYPGSIRFTLLYYYSLPSHVLSGAVLTPNKPLQQLCGG